MRRLHLLRSLKIAALIVVAAAVFYSLNQLSDTEASTFTPTSGIDIDVTTADTGNPDIEISLDVPGGDANFAGSGAAFISFLPGGWCIASHTADCSGTPAAVPVGTIVGQNNAISQLALQSAGTNSTCNQEFPVEFIFLEGTTNAAENGTISTSGATNVFLPLAEEDGTTGLPLHATKWPSFLTDLMDPDGPGGAPTLEPIARYTGDTLVSTSDVILQLLVYNPGDLQAFPGQPWQSFTAALGYPVVTVLQNPLDANNTSIADFCSPLLSLNTLLGTSDPNTAQCRRCANNASVAGGAVIHENGPGTGFGSGLGDTGTYLYQALVQSGRDADNDTYESALDTCPVNANADGDPRTNNGADNDGLDSACDPDDTTLNKDEDGDGWFNRLDNCPLVSNTTQDDQDIAIGTSVPDGGPPEDSIGVACDAAPTVPNGHYHQLTIKDFACNGAADTDGDGWCDAKETAMGTNPNVACNSDTTKNNEADAMPTDFDDDRKTNVDDRLLMVNQVLAFQANAANYDARFDLDADGGNDVGDRAAIVFSNGFSC